MSAFATAHGLPTRQDLVDMRIWDLHYHGWSNMDAVMPFVERMGIERLVVLDIGDSGVERKPQSLFEEDSAKLERFRDVAFGVTRIDPYDPENSVRKMNRWIANGPCIGIKYGGVRTEGTLIDLQEGRLDMEHLTCAHPNNDPIIERAAELDAIIYIHTWIKVGGDPRYPGGGNFIGESTPMDVAELADRHPDVRMVCGHSGGDWELGIRAIRPHENVFFEFSGGDPYSGAVDLAVNELGADRIVWGGHLSSRSYATELSKIYDGDLTDAQRFKILGANLREYAKPIVQRKGYDVTF